MRFFAIKTSQLETLVTVTQPFILRLLLKSRLVASLFFNTIINEKMTQLFNVYYTLSWSKQFKFKYLRV